MFVSDIMNTCVAECTEDMRLEEVFELIRKCDHGLVVVVDSHAHRVPIGVVTERSICEQIIARGRNPRNLAAGSVMDSRIKKVLATDLAESVQRDTAVAAVVVVDESRRVCGIVSNDRLNMIPSVANTAVVSPAVAVDQVRPAAQRRTIEIPAFGWIQ